MSSYTQTEQVDLSVIPSSGMVESTIDTWDAGSQHYRKWIEHTDSSGIEDLIATRPSGLDGATKIRYRLHRDSQVWLSIYSARGRLVRILVAGQQPQGACAIDWDGLDNCGKRGPPGVYFCRFASDTRVITRKLVLPR